MPEIDQQPNEKGSKNEVLTGEARYIAPRLKQEDIIFSADIAQCLVKEIPPVTADIIDQKSPSEMNLKTNDNIENKTIHKS